MNGKRVLLVSHVGLNLRIFRRALIELLMEQGAEVHCAVPRDKDAAGIEAMGATVHDWKLSRGSLNPLSLPGPVNALRALARDIAPHMVHSFTHQPNVFSRLALGTSYPLVNSVTGLGSNFLAKGPKGWLKRRVFHFLYHGTRRCPRAVIFQNGDDRAYFEKNRLLGELTPTMVRGTGVDTETLRPGAFDVTDIAAARAALGLSMDDVVFTLTARLIRDKGVFEFLKAAKALAKEAPNARFLLVGDADPGNPASLKDADIRAAQAGGNVGLAGWRSDMPLVWAMSDVAVLPSYREGLPVSLQEAMACALPVVTTDAPGCREVLDGERNGLAVPVRNAKALAHAMGRLAGDAALRKSMGEASRRIAEQRFNATTLAGQIVDVYRRILEENR